MENVAFWVSEIVRNRPIHINFTRVEGYFPRFGKNAKQGKELAIWCDLAKNAKQGKELAIKPAANTKYLRFANHEGSQSI